MKFFVDTADVAEIKDIAATGLLDGVTTNPSLILKSGRPMLDTIKEICAIVPGPVSAETVSTDYKTMLEEGRKLAKLAKNVAVKVPLTPDGLKTCKALREEGTMVNVTLCFSAGQALLAAKAGASFISPFVGRIDDQGHDGMELIREIMTIYTQYPHFKTEVLVASVRHTQHVIQAAKMGAHVATVPPNIIRQLFKHVLTDNGLKAFLDDWKKTGQSIYEWHYMTGDGTVTAPDGSGRQVKVITADDVVAYLKAHPNFFAEHGELATELGLVPRPQGPGVIDMQQAILKRFRSEIDKLKTERTEIIANSKQNQIVQNRIQAAVISIIQATTFEKMIHVVTHELPELLDVDFITLAIEANADAPRRAPVRGVYVLAPGAIDAAIGPDKHARLRSSIVGEDAFFGDVARFVKSDVLMRLKVSSGSPDAVMCFGAREPEAFGPDMATELLFFLAKVLENTMRAWLDLPE